MCARFSRRSTRPRKLTRPRRPSPRRRRCAPRLRARIPPQAEDRERAVRRGERARGRVPHGVSLALAARAALVVLGSAARRTRRPAARGAHTLRELRERARAASSRRGASTRRRGAARVPERRARRRARTARRRNTREELGLAATLPPRGERVVLVTSAAHAPLRATRARSSAAPAWRPRELLVAPCDDDAGLATPPLPPSRAARRHTPLAVVAAAAGGSRARSRSRPRGALTSRASSTSFSRGSRMSRPLTEVEEEPGRLAEAESVGAGKRKTHRSAPPYPNPSAALMAEVGAHGGAVGRFPVLLWRVPVDRSLTPTCRPTTCGCPSSRTGR